MRLRFERLSRRNLELIEKIALDCFGKVYVNKEVKKWLRRRLDRKHTAVNDVLEYYLVYTGKKPVGITGFYHVMGEKNFWLGYFGVVKEERRKGLGSHMLEQTLTMSKKFGCRQFGAWTTSKRASEFYRRNGLKKGKKHTAIIINGKIIYRYPRNSIFFYKNI